MGFEYERITKQMHDINTGFKKSDIGKWVVTDNDDFEQTIMTTEQKNKFKRGKLSYEDFDWE